MNVWTGREQAVRYCLNVAERELAKKQQLQLGIEAGLDADAAGKASAGSGKARDNFDDRKSRAEAVDDFAVSTVTADFSSVHS